MEQFFADMFDRLEDMHGHYAQYLDGLTTEELDWSPGTDMNSLCVLAVHVAQAERYWIGVGANDPIQRDRPAEFQASGHSVDDLKARFTSNLAYYKQTFESLSVNDFGEFVTVALNPDEPWKCTRSWALLHALDHTAEHLGHAGMTRQLLDKNVS
jgi:uncharacterized damage-inducible protein DinB